MPEQHVYSNKERIVKAAIDVFVAKGFRGTSIRDIANTLGTSASNIYDYFGNKEGLILGVIQHTNSLVISQLEVITKKENVLN